MVEKKNSDVDNIRNRLRRFEIQDEERRPSRLALGAEDEIITFDQYTQNYKYAIKNKDSSFFDYNDDENLNDYDFVIKEYTGEESYKSLNEFLRGNNNTNEDDDNKDLSSWTWCLHKALIRKDTNVEDNTWVYRGVKNKCNLEKGEVFYFAEFLSTSLDRKIAERFAQGRTLFEIKIKNNKKYPYCRDISKISDYEDEEEVLITAFCKYKVIDCCQNDKGLDIYTLICYGHKKI